MNIRSRRGARSLGATATATLAIGTIAALPAHLAFADAASSASASVVGGTLVIDGTDGPDAVTVGLGVDPATLRVDFGGGTPLSFNRADFTAISVYLGHGDDTFSVAPQGQFNDESLTVDGGQGDDTIGGSRGNDVLVGGPGNDTIRGSDGNDLLVGGAGDDDIDGERGADTQILGAGDDVALWLPGEGSDVTDGGGGHDTLVFNGAGLNEAFTVTANGHDAVLTRDLGSIRMDLDSVEALDLATLGGADTVTVGDLSGTDLHVTNLDLSSAGVADGQLDTVVINGTDHSDHVRVATDGSAVDVTAPARHVRVTGNDVRDQLQIITGNGNDDVDVSDAAAASIGISVDLGADQH